MQGRMPSTINRTLRCVAVTTGPYPRRWEMRVLATLARSGLAQPVAIWTADGRFDRSQLERLCRRRVERRALSLAPMAAPDETLGLPVLPIGDPPAAGIGQLDAVLDFRGDGADDRAWAQSARLGCWILRIGGGKSPSVGAGLLAAYCSAAPAIDVTLVQVDAGGAERALFAGRLPKRATLTQTADAVLLNLSDWYEVACRKLLAGHVAPAADAAPSLPSPPLAGLGAAWLAVRLLALRARWTLEIWNIGSAPRPPLEDLAKGGTLAGVTWLPPPPDLTFRADPFGWIDGDGRTAIAHERFDYRVGKGTLEIARLQSPPMAPSFEPLADLPVHASYPYLMPVPGLLLCLPEVNESGRTLLFKIETAPMRLTPVATLLDDVPLSDGTIFRFGKHHWLFGTRADRDYQLRLYAWFARAGDGPWTPHALNPIKCDITSARPAGMPFWAGGSLIRPAQDCSRSYGGAIALNRVLELTPSTFREEAVARIRPDRHGPYPDGIHTLSFVGDSILVDGKRHVFRWNAAALNRNFLLRRFERQAKLRAGALKR
jgi:hypothetical protein